MNENSTSPASRTDAGPGRIVVACGGTGGHFYPGLSVARAAHDRGITASLFLTGRAAAQQARLADGYGIPTSVLATLRAPVGIAGKAAFAMRLGVATWQHRRELRRTGAETVLAMGSFNAVPTVLAAASLSLPVVLHEGNARIGKANLFLSRWARHLAISFPPVNAASARCPWSVTGMPLRPELRHSIPTRQEAMTRLNQAASAALRTDLPTLLIFGGSQGARTLNQVLPQAVNHVATSSPMLFQTIHLAGANSFNEARTTYRQCPSPTLVLPSWEDMACLYAIADLTVCRAGGSTLAELARFGNGAILVPFPHATDLHQDDNAAHFTDADAAIVVNDAACTPEHMAQMIAAWLLDPESWRRRGRCAATLALPDAAANVLDLLMANVPG